MIYNSLLLKILEDYGNLLPENVSDFIICMKFEIQKKEKKRKIAKYETFMQPKKKRSINNCCLLFVGWI